jgi:hypothetical protein
MEPRFMASTARERFIDTKIALDVLAQREPWLDDPVRLLIDGICCACATKQHSPQSIAKKTTALLVWDCAVWIIARVPQAHTRAGQLCRA